MGRRTSVAAIATAVALAWSFRRQRNSAGYSATRRVRQSNRSGCSTAQLQQPIREQPDYPPPPANNPPPPDFRPGGAPAWRSVAAVAAAVLEQRSTGAATRPLPPPWWRAINLAQILVCAGPAPGAAPGPVPVLSHVDHAGSSRPIHRRSLVTSHHRAAVAAHCQQVGAVLGPRQDHRPHHQLRRGDGETSSSGALQVTPADLLPRPDDRDAKHRRLHRGRGGHAAG